MTSLIDANPDGTVDVRLTTSLGITTIAFALFEFLIMVVVSAIAIAMSYAAIASHRQLNWSLFAWLGAMLFALPAIRNTMPGIPGVGTVTDYTVYFWGLFIIGACLFAVAVAYIKRTLHQVKVGGGSDDEGER